MSEPLASHLRRRIALEGPLTVATFMAEALGHPNHGYYAAADRLGAAGDFITAPEISQMFGELVGLWCAHTWTELGCPMPVVLAELGPGRGTLMADAWRACSVLSSFRTAASLHLVETSPVYRALQAERLAAAQPVWHDRVEDLPDGPLLVIANEFFDALPIRQMQKTERGWAERRIAWDEETGGFRFVLDARPGLAALLVPAALRDAPVGSVAELAPAAELAARELGRRLARWGGAALIIDYGYLGPQCGDTLQAVRGHRPAAVLDEPGSSDLTAHVDFAAIAAAARAAGAVAWGPVSQGDFLDALGIRTRAERLAAAAPETRDAVESALNRLIGADEMGTLFRVLALTGPASRPPAGFQAMPD